MSDDTSQRKIPIAEQFDAIKTRLDQIKSEEKPKPETPSWGDVKWSYPA